MSQETMSYRRLGSAGIRVSAFSLGGWTTFGNTIQDPSQVNTLLRRAFDAGINFFDIADVYARGEAERLMGATLRQLPRHELVLSSKVYWPMSEDVNDRGLSRKHIIESVEKSLKRIGTDYLDLYFCHRYDDETSLDETVRAMDDLVRQGKILYWGTSEWSGAQLRAAHAVADKYRAYAPIVEQPQYSLLSRKKLEYEVLPAARELAMGLVVWSPLASGVLTGKYLDGIPAGSRLDRIEWLRGSFLREDNVERVRTFVAYAKSINMKPSTLALAWCAAQPGVSSVILGASSVEQLEENLQASRVQLDADTKARLDTIFAQGD